MGIYSVAVVLQYDIHTNNTPHSNKTTQTVKDTLHTMNTMQIQLQLQLLKK
jgi:hypothetical protein